MDRHIANEEIARATRLGVRRGEAVVLKLASAESAIKLGADHVLHDASHIVHARRVLLSFLRLLEHVADNSAQAAGSIKPDLEWLRREEFVHSGNPEILDRIEIDISVLCKLVQKGHIQAHVADAAATCPAALGGENARDAVPIQDGLNSI